VWALGNAGTQSSGLWQFLPDGAMSKHLHTAHAAEAGYVAASLAAHGLTGPAHILEGERGFFRALCPDPVPDALLAEPQGPWQLTRTSMKPWPCCRHVHPAIDAALEVHATLQGQKPTAVEVRTYQAALDVCDRPAPDSLYAAKFSLQHCVSVALADGRVDFDSFDERQRSRLADNSQATSLVVSPEFEHAYPARWGAAVSATISSGKVVSVSRKDCKGDPEAALSADEIIAKARMVMRQSGPVDDALIEQTLALPDADGLPMFPLRATAAASASQPRR